MKKTLLTFCLALIIGVGFSQTTHIITAAGLNYTPDSIMVSVGDTIKFNVGVTHPTLEVDQSTWNSNGITPLAGGFDFPSGSGTFVVTQPTTHYYVCTAHISSGMKGKIVAVGIDLDEVAVKEISIYPNPVAEEMLVNLTYTPDLEIRIMDMTGKLVQELQAVEGTDEQSFNISHLKTGHYLLQIIDGDASREIRFIKN